MGIEILCLAALTGVGAGLRREVSGLWSRTLSWLDGEDKAPSVEEAGTEGGEGVAAPAPEPPKAEPVPVAKAVPRPAKGKGGMAKKAKAVTARAVARPKAKPGEAAGAGGLRKKALRQLDCHCGSGKAYARCHWEEDRKPGPPGPTA